MQQRNNAKSVSDYLIDHYIRMFMSTFAYIFSNFCIVISQIANSYVILSATAGLIGQLLILIGSVGLLYSIGETFLANPCKTKRDYTITLRKDDELNNRLAEYTDETVEDLIKRLLVAHFNDVETCDLTELEPVSEYKKLTIRLWKIKN